MSRFIKDWLVSNEEKAESAPVIIQDGDIPKDDFSAASADDASDVETDKPAVADLPAASEGAPKATVKDQGHQTIRVSAEDDEKDESDDPEKDATDDEPASDEPEGDDVAKIEADEGNGSGDAAPEGVDETVTADDAEVTQVDEPAADEKDEPADTVPADDVPADDVEKDESDADEKDESDDSDETDEHEGERPASDDGDDGRDEDDLDDGREGYEEHEGTLDSPLENEMKASRNVEVVGEDVDALMRVTESLEAYHTLLTRSLTESDGISALTADMVRVGLESLDVSLGGTSVVLSMEAFGEHSSQRMATRLSMEGVGEAIKATVEAVKKAIKRLFEMLYDAFNQVVNGVGRAKTRLAAVVKELKDAPSSLDAVETSVSGAGRLTLDGKFAGNDADAVKLLTNVTNYMYDIYPKSCVALARNMDKEFKSAAKNGTIEERQRVHGMLTAAFKTQPWETVGQDPKDEAKVTSAEFPGGWKLERRIADVPKSSSSKVFDLKTTAYSFKENFDIRFETDSSIKSGESTAKYITPNAAGMKTLITALEGLITAAEQNKQAAVNYKLLGKHFSNYHQQIDYSADDGSVSQMFYYDMSRVMTRPAGPFNGYIGRTLNAYISILEHNLSAMKKAATPASDQKAVPAS